MHKLVRIVIAIVFSAFAVFAGAEDAVERPSLAIGDTWTYAITDDWKNVVQDTYTLQVSGVSDTEIRFVRESEKAGVVADVAETPSLNALTIVSSMDGVRTTYAPDNGTYAFPLSIGKTWAPKVEFKRPDRSGSYQLTTVVVGWEKVTVPAGEFTALKITQDGYYRSSSGTYSGTGEMHTIFWYAPAAKRMVRMQYRDSWNGFVSNRNTTQFVRYKVN